VFSGVFANVLDACFNVSNACFKCFICLHTYVANVSFENFKNRPGGAVGVIGTKHRKLGDRPHAAAGVRVGEVEGA
jgi:hypothetical protein